jgi:hypothetical protein
MIVALLDKHVCDFAILQIIQLSQVETKLDTSQKE